MANKNLKLQNINTITEMSEILTSSPIFKELLLQLGLDYTKEVNELFTLTDPMDQQALHYMIEQLNYMGIKFDHSLAEPIYEALNESYVGIIDAIDILLRILITTLRGEDLEQLLWKSTNIVEVMEVLYNAMTPWIKPDVKRTKQINNLISITHLIRYPLPIDIRGIILSHDPKDYLAAVALITVFTILLLDHNVVLIDETVQN